MSQRVTEALENAESRSVIFIAEDGEAIPLAQIRFDWRPEGDWEIDLSIAKAMRGRGLAARLISLGVQEISKENGDARIHAYVKPTNHPSIKAFEAAGFKQTDNAQVREHSALHFLHETT